MRDELGAAAIIVVVLAIAALLYPYAARINSVVSTNESSFMPRGVESIEVMDIVQQEGNSSAQDNYVFVVAHVPVNVSTFYRLNGTLTWGTSWVSVMRDAYSSAQGVSAHLLNAGVSTASGLVRLWEAVNNASSRLEQLNVTLSETMPVVMGADEAYSRIYWTGYNLTRLYSSALPQLVQLGNATSEVSLGYTATFLNTLRAEYVLVNMTKAYQTMNLTPQDVEVVESNCPQIGYVTPPPPQLIKALFGYVLSIGGPSRFNVSTAEGFTFQAMYQVLNYTGRSQLLPVLMAYSRAFSNASQRYYPELFALSGNLTVQNQYALYNLTQGMRELSSVEAMSSLVSSMNLSGQARDLLEAVAASYAEAGFNESELKAIVMNVTYEALSSELPGPVARSLASYVVNGTLTGPAAASLATEVIALSLPPSYSSYAPLLAALLPRELTAYDPGAGCAMCTNKTLLREAVSQLASEAFNVPYSVPMSLLSGVSPYWLAVGMVNQSLSSGQARALLEELASAGEIGSYRGLLIALPSLVNSSLVRFGVPANLSWPTSVASVSVLVNSSEYSVELRNLTELIFNRTSPTILGRLRGLLVQLNYDGFIVNVPSTVPYSQAQGLRSQLQDELRSLGYANATVMVTGSTALDYELSTSSMRSIREGDLISAVLVFVILAAVLGSVVALLVPFFAIGLGLVIALGLGFILASHGVIAVNSISRTVMYEAGLGLGIDYSTLISRRFREELEGGVEPRRAAWLSLRRSWRAVLTGGLTASIGFGAMSIATNFPFLTSLGEAVPIAILVTMAVSLALVPAVLVLAGRSGVLWWPSRPQGRGGAKGAGGAAGRYLMTNARAAAFVAAVLVAVVPASFVYATFRGSYDFTLMMPQGAPSVRALHYVTENYAAGLLYPVYVVAPNVTVLRAVNASISQLGCVQTTQLYNYSRPFLEVTLSTYPLGRQAMACAGSIRQMAKAVSPQAMVGGMPAVNLDLQRIVYHDFYDLVYPIAIVLMFLVLLAFFGGLPMAATALGSVVISAVLGTSLAVEVYRLTGTGLPWYLPIVVFTAILGVGMDYNSFIMNRVREGASGKGVRQAVNEAIGRIGALVIGLSTIMAGAFSGLLVFSAPGFRGMGLALMAGVLLAGLTASLLLTPSIIYLLGDRALWPWGLRGGRGPGPSTRTTPY
ncbi:MAG: MMPL family transporter [Acidilobus sp.]